MRKSVLETLATPSLAHHFWEENKKKSESSESEEACAAMGTQPKLDTCMYKCDVM